jgi:hypothetical protein
MPFQPVPNVALTRVEGVVDNQLTINDLYWEISGGGINAVNLATLVSAVENWVATQYAPLLSDDWSATRVVGIDLTTVTGPEVIQASTAIGGISGEANPNNVAICVSFRTAQRGRSFRGRNFIPAVPGSVVTLNLIDAGHLSNVLTAYNNLVGAGTFTPGWQFGVVSRRQGGVLLTNGVITPIISVIATSNFVRSMRSREVGHGS